MGGDTLANKLPFDLDSAFQHASKLQLKGGLAGKICHVLIYVALAMAAICWSVKLPSIAILSIALIFILSFVVLWRLINLADKNPQSALMEGAEFLLHEQIMVGTKSNPQLALSTQDVVVVAPLDIPQEERLLIEKPDLEPPKQLPPINPSDKGGK